jgi:hypothetical protein
MLILWSPDYFLRLWCAYEVAVYMSLQSERTHPNRRVIMIPLELVTFASLVFSLDLVIQVVSVNFFFQGSNGMPEWATQLTATAIAALFACFAYFFSYRWIVDQAFLRKQLAEFKLSQVECSDPSDRPLVLRDIAKRYAILDSRTMSSKNIPQTDPSMSDQVTREPTPVGIAPSIAPSISRQTSIDPAGLGHFEEYVRTNLQGPIDKALGSHHWILPYKFSFAMSLPAVWAAMGLMCHWILKARGMGDTTDTFEGQAVAFLIASKLLRSITFYPLLTAALLLYQDVTERFIKGRTLAQVIRGIVAVGLIGAYFYMFGFHYIFLREMEPDLVFYTTLPQVLLFLLIYTRLGTFAYRWINDFRARCRRGSTAQKTFAPKPPVGGQVSIQTVNDLERAETRSYASSDSPPTPLDTPNHLSQP